MPALARPAMTLADFLAWEAAQTDVRHEFVDGEVFAMTAPTLRHGVLVGNLYTILRAQLHPRGCQVFPEGTMVRAGHDIFRPDTVVACGGSLDLSQNLIERPTLIAEVLSPSTERYDRNDKWDRYREQLPDLRAYVLVSQTQVRVEAFHRGPDGWHYTTHDRIDEILELADPACRIALADLYERTALG